MSEQNTENEEFAFTTDFVIWPKPVEGSYDEESQTEAAEVALVQVGLGVQPCILIKPGVSEDGTNVLEVNVSEMELASAAFLLGTLADGLKSQLRERGQWDDSIDDTEVTYNGGN